jgi:NADP-dependent 3-hydroxy acid dehydrogenase YdfG
VATKHGLTGLTRSLSLDGREYDIACGQIDIGNAATTRNEDTARGLLQASGKIEPEARIDVNDVARGVSYMASLPLEANVQFMTVMATKMPYIGRG